MEKGHKILKAGNWMKRVSVIIPVFNMEKYLNKCLSSVLGQTYENLQIIVVNDGSTDGSENICKSYAEKDKRITVITKSNSGISDALNVGLAVSNGEYILFLDSDDYLEKNCIELLMSYTAGSEDEIIQAGMIYRNTNDKKIKKRFEKACFITGNGRIVEAFLRKKRINPNFAAKLYSAGLFANVRWPDKRLIADTITNFYLLENCTRYVIVENCVYNCLQRNDSVSRALVFNEQKYDDRRFTIEELERIIMSKYPSMTAELSFRKINYALVCYDYIYRTNFEGKEEEARRLLDIIRNNLKSYRKIASKCGDIKLTLKINLLCYSQWLYGRLILRK